MDISTIHNFSVVDICKSYGDTIAVNNVSIAVPSGKCVGVLGNNGSGKSTLLSIFAGAIAANSGNVLIDGECIKKADRRSIGYVAQVPVLIDEISVLDNLRLWHSAYELADFEKVLADIPDFLGVAKLYKKLAGELSGGMKKKVSIAIALMPKLKFLILDEAFSALDSTCATELASYLHKLKGSGVGIVYCSHNINEIEKLCDVVYVLNDGSISFSATADIFTLPDAVKQIYNHF